MSLLIVIKVTLVLTLGLAAATLMRQASASTRHLLLTAVMLVCLLLPVTPDLLPGWQVLPAAPVEASLSVSRIAVPVTDSLQTGSGDFGAAGAAAIQAIHRASAASMSGISWVVLIWAAGFAVFLARLLTGITVAERDSRSARAAEAVCLGELCVALGIRRPVRLKHSAPDRMPSVWGYRRPVILLPETAQQWTDERRRDVIAHELAHVARGDGLTLLVAHLFLALYWFHPLAWVLKRRLTEACERAADDLALSAGAPPSRYADHLLQTATDYQHQYSVAPVMAERSQLEQRIMAILSTSTNRSSNTEFARITVLLVAALALIPVSSIGWAQEGIDAGAVAEGGYGQSDSQDFAIHLQSLGIQTSDTDALLAGLFASNPLTRGASAWALGGNDDPRVVEPLIQAGYDVDARVRQWALRSLALWPQPAVAALQIDRLQDTDAEVRQWAVRGLSNQDEGTRVQPLLGAMADADAEVREWAARGLAGIDDQPVSTALAARLAIEPNADAAEWLTRTLSGADTANVDAILGALQNPDAEVRQWAVRGLSGSSDDRVLDAIIGMLGDEDAEVRQWSARALGYCGNDRAVAPLEGLSSDSDAEVREWALSSLDAIECTSISSAANGN